jgi:hypothetical protein
MAPVFDGLAQANSSSGSDVKDEQTHDTRGYPQILSLKYLKSEHNPN